MNGRGSHSLFFNLCYLGAARAGAVAMNLVTTSRLAHALGTENFGINNFAISYLSYFLIVVNLGFETFITREVAADHTRLRRLVSSVIALRLVLAAVMTVALLASLPLLRFGTTGRIVILIQALNLFTAAIGLSCAYQGLQRMRVVAGRECIASLANVACVLWLVHAPGDLVRAACIAVAAQLLTNVAILAQYTGEFGFPRLRLPGRETLRLVRQSMAFFWSLLMIAFTYNTHIVLLGLLRSEAEIGLFSAGWKLFIFAIAVPNLIATLFLPRIANLGYRPGERDRAIEFFAKSIIICAIPITMFGILLTPQILGLLFGAAYLSAAPVLVLLLLNALVVAVNIGLGTTMQALGRQNSFVRVVATGAAIGVALNALLIPLYGAEGAAIATLADEIAILLLLFRCCPEMPSPQVIGFTMRCVLAIIPAAAAVHCVPLLPVAQWGNLWTVLTGGAVGSLVYVLGLHVLRIDLRHFAADLRGLQ